MRPSSPMPDPRLITQTLQRHLTFKAAAGALALTPRMLRKAMRHHHITPALGPKREQYTLDQLRRTVADAGSIAKAADRLGVQRCTLRQWITVVEPDAPAARIPGQCLDCTCPTRTADYTTDTHGITIRRTGTCRRDQAAIDDLLVDVSE